jgi:hypothetical protein
LSRIPNELGDNKCGIDECYFDENGGNVCVKECSKGSYYEGKPNGRCELKACTSRSANFSENLFCGNESCYFDINSGYRCVENCDHSNLFGPVNGICTLKTCTLRTPEHEITSFPCGNGCYLYSNENNINSCVSVCPSEYYDVSNKGICSKVNCDDGSVIIEGEVCKYHCIYDRFDKLCHLSCSNVKHYEIINKTCMLKECSKRKVNYSERNGYVCGSSDCYEDINDKIQDSDENKCKTSCLYAEHYYGADDGKCKLKECSERLFNRSTTIPCGTDCYFDINDNFKCSSSCSVPNYKPVNGICTLPNCVSDDLNEKKKIERLFLQSSFDSCVLDEDGFFCKTPCVNLNHYSKFNGTCKLKRCSLRTADGSEGDDFRCGTDKDNCFLDGDGCSEICSFSEYYEENSDDGKCKLKECELRKRNLSLDNACGNDSCYLEIEGEDEKCVRKCSNEDYYEDDKNKKCRIMCNKLNEKNLEKCKEFIENGEFMIISFIFL